MTLFHVPIKLEWPGPGGPGVNIWDIRTTGSDPGDGDVDLNTMVDALGDFYGALNSASLVPGGYTASFEGQATTIDDEPIFVDATPWSTTRTGTAASAPPTSQFIVTLRTTSATRRGRGRKFLGPVAASAVATDGTPTSTAMVSLQNALDILLDESTGFANGAIGVYSEAGSVFRDAIQMQARNYFAVLRSRRD